MRKVGLAVVACGLLALPSGAAAQADPWAEVVCMPPTGPRAEEAVARRAAFAAKRDGSEASKQELCRTLTAVTAKAAAQSAGCDEHAAYCRKNGAKEFAAACAKIKAAAIDWAKQRAATCGAN